MSDFTDFLAAMAIEDSMEDEKGSTSNQSPRNRAQRTNEPVTPGCLFICVCIILAIALGAFLESWAWFFGIAAFGVIAGFAYDIHQDWKKKEKEESHAGGGRG